VKGFHTDGGGEYVFMTFAEYLASEGILKKMTTPYTPQSNEVVEWATARSCSAYNEYLSRPGF
jgi:hypothetical protein